MTNKSDKTQKVFEFADLSKYSFKERLVIRLADLAFYFLISLIGKTVRFEVEGWENFEQIEQDKQKPIITFWHNRIFLGTYFFRRRKIVVMTSQSLDGEYIARFIQRFGYGASRGSSTRGGIKSLVEMVRLMREGLPTGFSIDGPKGPKYVAKSGACLLAKKSNNPLLPFPSNPKNFGSSKAGIISRFQSPFHGLKPLFHNQFTCRAKQMMKNWKINA
jgi:lysophospholipid acyltransferase (LPLAT)-like uncharacterized protein